MKSQPSLSGRDHSSVPAKVAYALERIATAIASLKRDAYSKLGLSVTQGDILVFLASHPEEPGRVSLLSQEFLVSEATISDAVSALVAKGLIKKKHAPQDARQVTLTLTPKAKSTIAKAVRWEQKLREIISPLKFHEPGQFLLQLLLVIDELLVGGVITQARMCLTCRFLVRGRHRGYFCRLLEKPLMLDDLRVDCEDYEPAPLPAKSSKSVNNAAAP